MWPSATNGKVKQKVIFASQQFLLLLHICVLPQGHAVCLYVKFSLG